MIITCVKCNTRYKLADDFTDKDAFKVRCSKCKHHFVAYKTTREESSLLLQDEVKPDYNKIIAISNQKGGVAKTSTCLNLGVALTQLKKRVLLVDFDVQANLTILLGFRKTRSFYEILETKTRNVSVAIESTRYPGLDLLPSNSKMALLKKKYLNKDRFEYLLRDRLNMIKDDYDHILIDTPPSIEFFTLNALVAANYVVIPTTCEYLSMHGINQINDILTVVKREINQDIDQRILITMHNAKNTSEKVMYQKILDKFNGRVFDTCIELDDKMQESHIVNMPVLQYAKDSTSARQYLNLAKEIVGEASG